MIKREILSLCVLLLICIVLLSSCDPVQIFYYTGEYKDLESAALASIPGLFEENDKIVFLETDDYGRILYGWFPATTWSWSPKGCCALLIVQKADKENVWFYSEQNYELLFIDQELRNTIDETGITKELCYNLFSEQTIENLKEKNDWGNAFDSSRDICKVKIELHKKVFYKPSKTVLDYFEERKINDNRVYHFFREDVNGNQLVSIDVRDRHRNNEGQLVMDYSWYLVVVDNKGDLLGEDYVLEIKDLNNPSNEVANFLSRINWEDI